MGHEPLQLSALLQHCPRPSPPSRSVADHRPVPVEELPLSGTVGDKAEPSAISVSSEIPEDEAKSPRAAERGSVGQLGARVRFVSRPWGHLPSLASLGGAPSPGAGGLEGRPAQEGSPWAERASGSPRAWPAPLLLRGSPRSNCDLSQIQFHIFRIAN